MPVKIFTALFLFTHLLLFNAAFSQSKPDTSKNSSKSRLEAYDYKYTYSGRGKYYLHGELVKKSDYDSYIKKCDSISKANGQNENIVLAAVPEVEVVSEIAIYGNNETFIGTGLNITLPLNLVFKNRKKPFLRYLSFNWKVLLGNDNNSDFYLHTNGITTIMSRIPLGTPTESGGNSVGVDLLTLIALTIPEGVSYHIPLGDHLRITAFCNPLGGDYWKNSKFNYAGGTPTLDFGIKPGFVTSKKFTWGATLGYKSYYSDSENRGFYGGVSLGLQLY
jgi:hypothetical protein